MAHGFLTSRERIARAKTHREALGQAWAKFIDEPDAYDIGVRVEDEGTGGIWIQPTRPLPPVLSLEVGEMLYQLRAALDACIYQAAILESGLDPPPDENSLEFPICLTEATFNSSARKFRPLSNKKLRDFIRHVQPYYIPHLNTPGAEWLPETLAILNDWARKDRHRNLHIMGSWPSQANPQLRLPDGVTIRSMEIVGLGLLLGEESQLATFVLDGWKPGLHIEANPDVFIDVASNEPPPPKDASDTLDMRTKQMIAAVELVTKAFEQTY